MIYTVTFNPSIDYVVFVDTIKYGDVNRTCKEYIFPGGKGINVSCVLTALNIENIATGFVAGFTGAQLESMLSDMNITCRFIHIQEGMSRINVKVKADSGFEINGKGPCISENHLNELFNIIDNMNSRDYLVIGGSMCSGVSTDCYARLVNYAGKNGVKCIVDTTKDALKNAIKEHPFLIKPNKKELEELLAVSLPNVESVVKAAGILKDMGALNVLVSLGEDGAVLVTEDNQVYYASAPKVQVINDVGAGDSMVAGFLAGYINTGQFDQALKLGACAGSASAFSKGLPDINSIMSLMDEVVIENVTI